MNKAITILSCSLAITSFLFMFTNDVFVSTGIGMIAFVALIVAFKVEYLIKTNGNEGISKIIYYLTRDDEKYNILNKQYTYAYIGDNKYQCTKKYNIYPTCNDLDRINDKFAWSAPSAKAIIKPTERGHEINKVWQQDMWTCLTIYFNERCVRHRPYQAGIIIDNLIDEDKLSSPYLSMRISKKTKVATMLVKIPQAYNPRNGQLRAYSPKSITDESFCKDIDYDESVGGYVYTVEYPRKGWKYVISWEMDITA